METKILDAIRTRRARRSLSSRAIPETQMEALLRASAMAPSCFNNQPWRFVAIDGQDSLASIKATLADANAWASPSPAVIAVCTEPSLDCRLDEGRDYAAFDTGLAAMCLMLQAESMGIIAHPVAGFNARKAKKAIAAPDSIIVIALIALGYPGTDSVLTDAQAQAENEPRSRLEPGEVFYRNRWGTPWN